MFDSTINPATIFLGAMVLIGIFGVYGSILEHFDKKRGHCDIG